ncbi:MAG TPA: TIGR03435 family protein [Vicinamibacterales bacterium]|nr:TIGR03435 family protein [Vicinamibacterales bacterium]
MKKLPRLIVVLLTLFGSVTYAQNVAGNWQGSLNAGKELRIVFVISNDGGTLKATMYSIDQGAQGIPATTVTLQGTTLRITIAGISGSFVGNLNANESTITGTWTQGGASLPLVLNRATTETAWAIPKPPKPIAADTPAVFDVATIRPANPDMSGKIFTVRGRQVTTINTTVNDLITFSYGLHERQISGGPAWAGKDKYDVTGAPAGQGLPTLPQMRTMIQQLLADRFKLSFHRDKRNLPVYSITVASGGPKLTRNDSNPNGLPGLLFRGLGVLPGSNATIDDLASVMQSAVLDRPVVDRTGLPGRYDFMLRWTPDETQFAGLDVRVPAPSNSVDAPPALFTAFQEQLGLKLESTRAPVEVLVIDRIDRPSEN